MPAPLIIRQEPYAPKNKSDWPVHDLSLNNKIISLISNIEDISNSLSKETDISEDVKLNNEIGYCFKHVTMESQIAPAHELFAFFMSIM